MKIILLSLIVAVKSNFLYGQTEQIRSSKNESIEFKVQRDNQDFENKVQRPFNQAYGRFKEQVNEISGNDNAIEFLKKIPDTLNFIDSLKIALYVQAYKNATITYRLATITWICEHTDSYKSPSLIQAWWPKEGWKIIYTALSENVKEQKSAETLKKMIKKQKNEK